MFAAEGDSVIGRSERLEVVFDRASGAIRKLANRATGQVLVDGESGQPWRMTAHWIPWFLPPHIGERYRGREIKPAECSFELDDGGAARLTWSTSDPGVVVHVRAGFSEDGSLELWPRVAVSPGTAPPVTFAYPIVSSPRPLSPDGATDRLVFPGQSGWVIRSPLEHVPLAGGYPDGYDGCSLQFIAYYAEDAGGFYVGCHDPHSTWKWIRFSAEEVLFEHEAWDLREGASLDLDYPVVVAPLEDGHWHEAAERYRAWALAEAPWCRGAVPNARNESKRGVRWLYEDVGLSIWGTPSSLDWSRWYRFYADCAGTPLHICAGWDWPASRPHTVGHEGWFPARFHPANLEAWREHHVTPYMNDLFISSRAEGFLERWEPNLIFPYATFPWPRFAEFSALAEADSSPADPAVTTNLDFWMCPATEAQGELHAWRDTTLARDYGADGVCYDISSGNPRLGSRCLREEHGHPPGRGRALIEAYDRVNRRSKEAAAAETGRYLALGVETIMDSVVGSVDFYVSRACAGPLGALENWVVGPEDPVGGTRELIPLFEAVYHDVGPVHEDGWLTLSAEEGDLFYWVAARIVLQWGGLLALQYATNPPERVPGFEGPAEVVNWDGATVRFDHLPEPDAGKIAFVRELARARTQFGRPYLAYGRLLRPLPIEAGTVELTYSHRLHALGNIRTEGRWTAPEVLHGAWADDEGNIGLFFVNLRDQGSVTIPLRGDPRTLWGLDLSARSAVVTASSGSERAQALTPSGDLRLELALAPRVVTLVEFESRVAA